MPFRRSLPDPLINELNALYAQPGTWWRRLVDDRGVFIAIRDGYLNAYAHGASIARVGYDRRGVCCKVHIEYLTSPATQAYVRLDDPEAPRTREVINTFAEYARHLGRVKRRAAQFSGDERAGENLIATRICTVLDIETAFSGQDAQEEGPLVEADGGYDRGRVDMVLLDQNGRLVFAEIKHFTNGELRARQRPAVCDQLLTYHRWLTSNEAKILGAYNSARHIFGMLDGIRERPVAPSVIDLVPRLVIFGYDRAQIASLREITDAIVQHSARDIRGFCGQHVVTCGKAASFQENHFAE